MFEHTLDGPRLQPTTRANAQQTNARHAIRHGEVPRRHVIAVLLLHKLHVSGATGRYRRCPLSATASGCGGEMYGSSS